MHRADLHNLLLQAFITLVPQGVHTGKALRTLTEHQDQVALVFADGTQVKTRAD